MQHYGEIQSVDNKFQTMGGFCVLDELMESEAFVNGVTVGIGLYQQKVIAAQKQKIPLKIGEDLYYVQDGRERLQEMIKKICK